MESTEVVSKLTTLYDKSKFFLKGLVIFVMAIFLWIPTHFIMEVIRERENRQKEAIADISNKWAGKQTVTGPILMVPFRDTVKDVKGNIGLVNKNAYFLPEKNDIRSRVMPEKRKRGIYEVVVYRSETTMDIKFNPLPWKDLNIPAESFNWKEAVLIFSVTDNLKGINEDIYLNWDSSRIILNPQPPGLTSLAGAFVASIPLSPEEVMKEHTVHFEFSLNGSEQLLFTTTARENKLQMQSAWANPSFTGVKLPDSRTVNKDGFNAEWKFMNRSVPQVWKDNFFDLSSSVLGTDLMITVDSYNKTERSVKYALLCIILTFAAFFLVESIYKRPLHLMHYGLAGLALVLFYSLLLSISEYTGYNLAYLIAGVATIALVAWFIGSVLRSTRLALFIGLVLTVVYSYIFTIIQLQDYALLMGSIGLFIALGIIMYFSRKLQW